MYNTRSIYKYRLNEMLEEVDSSEVRTYVLGILLYELGISLEQFLHKKDALLNDPQSFTVKEIEQITDVLNRIRPYKRKLGISDLYHPILNIDV